MSASYDAKITSGDIVDPGADGQHRVNVEVISAKPLEFFWEKFATVDAYDDDAIREECQQVAAAEVLSE